MRIKTLLPFLVCSILFTVIAKSQSPSILWRFNTHDESFGNAAMAGLKGDGSLQIAFSCYWGDSNIYVLNATDGSLVWKQNMGGCNDAAPIIYDIDGKGKPDVILASSCNPVLTCFTGATGVIKWQTPFGGTDSPPSIADIDGDGKPEILTGDFEGNLNCFTADSGKLKWKVSVDSNAAIEAAPALVDINGDGHPDIIVCTWAYGGSGDSTAVYAYDGMTHKLLWKNPLPTDVIYHGAAFADVTEDGTTDLAITSYDGNVYLLKGSDGSLEWNYPTPGLAYIADPVVIGDINNDGHLELVYINGDGEVDALDRFGNFKWSFMMPAGQSSFCGASLADVNNDDTLDVIFAGSDGSLYALNGSRGNLLWSIDLRADYGDSLYEFEHGAIINSFKQDDTLDIFIAGGHTYYPNIDSDFGRAYAVKVGLGKTSWTMFQHDYTRSNCVCNPAPNAVNELRNNTEELRAYPNPFTDNINFNISLTADMPVSVKIYSAQGTVVKTFADKKLSTGNYQFTWNGTNDGGSKLAPGVYYCRIIAGSKTSVRKVVLMK
ncbi:MAG TPA: FG-GAP-like repeat-containing protein [Bacteroidia bacterium]|nr:FG-GAP-like repeat-containing protein [Bacteroidia bacterium]